jgi:hypothetical protein
MIRVGLSAVPRPRKTATKAVGFGGRTPKTRFYFINFSTFLNC